MNNNVKFSVLMPTYNQCAFIIGLLAFLFIPLSGLALDLTQSIPESKAVKKGVLKNGMTYYICKTAKNELLCS